MAATVRTLDFTGVKDQSQFNPRRKKEGDYYAHIVAVDDHTSKSDNTGWVFTITVDGDARASFPYYTQDESKSLWKIRGLYIAAGTNVPKKRFKIDPNKLVGKAIAVSLEDDEYEGRLKSVIAGVFPIDELTGPVNEPSKGGKTKAVDPVDDEDDEDDEEEEAPVKAKAKRTKKSRKVVEVVEEDDEDEDDEEDEEPPPPKKKAKKETKKAKKKAVVEDDDDEDDDLDLDEL